MAFLSQYTSSIWLVCLCFTDTSSWFWKHFVKRAFRTMDNVCQSNVSPGL